MFGKQKEEMQKTVNNVTSSFGENVKHVVKESKLMVFLVMYNLLNHRFHYGICHDCSSNQSC